MKDIVAKEYKLDESQRKVVEATGGYHLVLAPPGCGKTHILVERIRRAREQGTDYADMLCLTFTNRAAREMINRIDAYIGNDEAADLQVGNVHHFCSKFLFEESKVPADTSIIDDEEAVSIIADYRNEAEESVMRDYGRNREYQNIIFLSHFMYQLRNKHDRNLYLHPECYTDDDRAAIARICRIQGYEPTEERLISIYENALSFMDDADSLPWKEAEPVRRTLRKMYYAAMYEQYKEDNHMVDFEDLLLMTYDCYRQDDTCRKYKWVQVDEVQDLNAMQLAIIDLLTAKDDATVMYLGDEQQAIFSFMGAKTETLAELKQRAGNNVHHLMKNHRSPGYLLEVFNEYAEKQLHIDSALLPKTDNKDVAEPGRLRILYSSTNEAEVTDVVKEAQSLHETYPDETTAVIVSSNADADKISEAMENAELKHFKVSGRDLFDTPEMKLINAHLNVVANPNNFICWARVLRGMNVFASNPLARRFMRKLRQLSISPVDFLLYDDTTYTAEFAAAYESGEMVVFDTETTGLDVFADDVIEISAMRIKDGKAVGEPLDLYIRTDKDIPLMLGTKINPLRSIYDERAVTGDLLTADEAMRRFLDYVGTRPLLGHNVDYDYRIVENNIKRRCGGAVDVSEWQSKQADGVFDSLRLMRLLEPGLNSYKLEFLLKAFNLEGVNSHQAIDDVAATVSLTALCHIKASQQTHKQREFMAHPKVRPLINKLRANYKELYIRTVNQLYNRVGEGCPAIVSTIKQAHEYLCDGGFIERIGKLSYVTSYIEQDLMDEADMHLSLKENIDKYVMDVNTMKEADFCNSRSIREKVYVTTVHKAKGLEFDNIIVFDAVAGRYPNFYNKTKKQDEEDARKFYVAMSRAKRRLYIAYGMASIDRYGSVFPREITPFMESVMRFFG